MEPHHILGVLPFQKVRIRSLTPLILMPRLKLPPLRLMVVVVPWIRLICRAPYLLRFYPILRPKQLQGPVYVIRHRLMILLYLILTAVWNITLYAIMAAPPLKF